VLAGVGTGDDKFLATDRTMDRMSSTVPAHDSTSTPHDPSPHGTSPHETAPDSGIDPNLLTAYA